jgi:glycosyltransferase involved in cell wall biosynthesis
MEKSKPLISVVMPAYNAQKYIRRAVESILHQTFKRFEFIIINDASTDKTLQIIKLLSKKDSRIKIVNNDTRLNIATSLNRGISFARSNIIARMDADDIAVPHRLERQYDCITKSENIAVAGADILIIDTSGNHIATRRYPESSGELKKCLLRYSPFAHPVVMFKKNFFDEAGKYNPKYSPTEDLDLWFRLGRKYEFVSVPEQLLKYRVYKESSSHSALKNLELLVFKIRLQAIRKYGYRPGLYDIIYNILQFLTLWCTSANCRIKIYNVLRNNDLI